MPNIKVPGPLAGSVAVCLVFVYYAAIEFLPLFNQRSPAEKTEHGEH